MKIQLNVPVDTALDLYDNTKAVVLATIDFAKIFPSIFRAALRCVAIDKRVRKATSQVLIIGETIVIESDPFHIPELLSGERIRITIERI